MTVSARGAPAWVLLALMFACAPGSHAALDAARVTALNAPAWLVRDGRRSPLRPDLVLRAGDRIHTGNGARVRLELADGSRIKLGSETAFGIERAESSVRDGVFRGVLNLLAGALRYSTRALERARPSQITLRIHGASVRIRSADVWGRTGEEEDIVCLVEGALRIERAGESAQEMREPLTFLRSPHGGVSLPVALVAREQLARWAGSVELLATHGVLSEIDGYAVILRSMRAEEGAARAAARFAELGYPARVEGAIVRGQRWYRVAIRGFADRSSAAAFASQLDGRHGVTGAWVSAPR